MNRPKALPVVLVVLAAVASVIAVRRMKDDVTPERPLYVASYDPGGDDAGVPAPTAASPPFWTRRIGGEVLVLSAPGPRVEFLDAAGRVVGTGRLDPAGAFRGAIPGGAGSLVLKFAGGSAAAWRIPEPAGTIPRILSDRAVLRPGDRVRFCVREQDGGSAPVLRFEPRDAAVPPPVLASPPDPMLTKTDGFRWRIWETVVPDDVRPGTAIVTTAGGELELPLVSRCAGGGEDDGGGGTPDAPPAPADPGNGAGGGILRLESRDGRWRAEGPADAGPVLFFAESGGRLLAHQAVAAIDGHASTPLPLGDDPPARVRVTAVASTPGGFIEASTGNPGVADAPDPVDVVFARFLLDRPRPEPVAEGPAWIHEGDEFAGGDPAPPARPGFLGRTGRGTVPVNAETAVLLPPNVPVRWSVRPAGASGVVRIRGDGAILAEAKVGAGRDGGEFRTGDPAPRSLLFESGDAGIESLAYEWALDGRAAEAPAAPVPGASLDRTLPPRGRVGDEVVYTIVIHTASPSAVTCPIPRGAVLAEDGWAIRARAPAGTRVETPDGAVVLRVPGDASVSFRIRLAWPGRYAAPAATAGDARSASGFMVIE